MSNNKTAVDWLFHQLWEEPKDKFTWYAILEKARKMHKEQIIESFKHGEMPKLFSNLSAEQYYNEEYGTKLD